MEAQVRWQRRDGVVEVVLAAPDRGNVIDLPWADAFEEAVGEVGADDRCLLLHAEGPNFCFGGDVATFAGDDPGDRLRHLADRLHDGLRRLDAIEVPVVALVQGWATGAGFSLACAADILVAGAGARFKSAYNALGLIADGGLTWHLPRRLPRTVALDLLLTDRVLGAEEAARLGLVARVLPDDELLDGGRRLADTIARGSRSAAVTVKGLVRSGAATELDAQLDAEAVAMGVAADGADGREGIAAFLARRPPDFRA